MQETIGEGEYAKVRKALHTETGELVAIKILGKKYEKRGRTRADPRRRFARQAAYD